MDSVSSLPNQPKDSPIVSPNAEWCMSYVHVYNWTIWQWIMSAGMVRFSSTAAFSRCQMTAFDPKPQLAFYFTQHPHMIIKDDDFPVRMCIMESQKLGGGNSIEEESAW